MRFFPENLNLKSDISVISVQSVKLIVSSSPFVRFIVSLPNSKSFIIMVFLPAPPFIVSL